MSIQGLKFIIHHQIRIQNDYLLEELNSWSQFTWIDHHEYIRIRIRWGIGRRTGTRWNGRTKVITSEHITETGHIQSFHYFCQWETTVTIAKVSVTTTKKTIIIISNSIGAFDRKAQYYFKNEPIIVNICDANSHNELHLPLNSIEWHMLVGFCESTV